MKINLCVECERHREDPFTDEALPSFHRCSLIPDPVTGEGAVCIGERIWGTICGPSGKQFIPWKGARKTRDPREVCQTELSGKQDYIADAYREDADVMRDEIVSPPEPSSKWPILLSLIFVSLLIITLVTKLLP